MHAEHTYVDYYCRTWYSQMLVIYIPDFKTDRIVYPVVRRLPETYSICNTLLIITSSSFYFTRCMAYSSSYDNKSVDGTDCCALCFADLWIYPPVQFRFEKIKPISKYPPFSSATTERSTSPLWYFTPIYRAEVETNSAKAWAPVTLFVQSWVDFVWPEVKEPCVAWEPSFSFRGDFCFSFRWGRFVCII